jgi:hypothetical protein
MKEKQFANITVEIWRLRQKRDALRKAMVLKYPDIDLKTQFVWFGQKRLDALCRKLAA